MRRDGKYVYSDLKECDMNINGGFKLEYTYYMVNGIYVGYQINF